MKKITITTFVIFAVLLIVPSVTHASWWNPLTWHWNVNIFSKSQTNTGISHSSNTYDDVYNKFCSSAVNINYTKTDYSSEFTQKLASLKIEDLTNNLAGDFYSHDQIPEALQYFGLKLMQENKIDDSLKIYKCAAEKYYDMISMYRMARIYQSGTDNIKEQIPNAVINSPILPDFKQSYYWIISLMYVELSEKTGMINAGTQIGWNSIALLDDLQNTGKLSASDMKDIESKAIQFISKRYPDVGKTQGSLYSHSLGGAQISPDVPTLPAPKPVVSSGLDVQP